MQLITDSASCTVTLRNASLYIACFFLASIVLGVIAIPNQRLEQSAKDCHPNPSNTKVLSHTSSLIFFIFEFVGNLALLFGALWGNQWLVLVWLINAAIKFFNWPIGLLGVIFNFGGYRQSAFFDNIFLIIIEYIIVLILFAYCARIVYSYFHQLRNTQTNPQHSVAYCARIVYSYFHQLRNTQTNPQHSVVV